MVNAILGLSRWYSPFFFKSNSLNSSNYLKTKERYMSMENPRVLSFMSATGKIEYNMTNNYMFRYILQEKQKVLKGLICSLLHLKPDQIKTVTIENPIDLAADVSGKEFILDMENMSFSDLFDKYCKQIKKQNEIIKKIKYILKKISGGIS